MAGRASNVFRDVRRDALPGDAGPGRYVFLLPGTPEGWSRSRAEFIALAGPTPVLPDWAFGIWYTWWNPYNESFAKLEIARWATDKLPLDVWVRGAGCLARRRTGQPFPPPAL